MKPKLSLPAMTPFCSGAAAMPDRTLGHWVPFRAVLWLPPQMREREAKLWDTRHFSSALASVTLDTSPG